jgi:FkbM family methyltransferase
MRVDGRWPRLAGVSPVFVDGPPRHLAAVEPLAVQAFTTAVAKAAKDSLVVDVGSNVGAFAVLAALMGASVLAVDMQPACVARTACNLKANRVESEVRLAYVTADRHAAPIRVPDDDCAVMASPTAVAGRFPHGLLQKKTRVLYGLDNRTHTLSPDMRMVPVPPLHVGSYLATRRPLLAPSVVKIDTEGFEIAVLESLRPTWRTLTDVVVELQPRAWRHANVTLGGGVRVLQELVRARRFSVVTLPHADRRTNASSVAAWEACGVPLATSLRECVPGRGGVASARRFGADGLRRYVESVHSNPTRHGFFSEVLLTQCAL